MVKEKKQAYDLNIYHVDNTITLEEYKEIFKTKKSNYVHCNLINEEDYSILYYTYKNQSDSQEIEWFKEWKKFFKEINEPLRRTSQSGHGVIVIHLKEKEEKYALLFGRSFTLIKENIISQFGMDMASILFDGTSIDSISSKYFSLNKNKSITSYYGDSTFNFADNEAVDLLKANIVDYPNDSSLVYKSLLDIIKPRATVGLDNLKITIYKKEIELCDVINICTYIDEIRTKFVQRFVFPKMIPANAKISEILDQKLLNNIINNDVINFEFSVPLYTKATSDEFEFLNNIDEIIIKIGRNESTILNTFDTAQIFEFVKENIAEISNIRNVKIITDGEVDSLIKWIDTQVDYNGKTYALYDSKWFEFNQSYIDNINKRVQSLESDIIEIDHSGEYKFSERDKTQYFNENKKDIQETYGDATPYREYIYNYKIAKNKGYKLFDRITFNGNIEVCDLYGDKMLIHCKMGSTSNLEECLRQSIYGAKYFHQNKLEVQNKENKLGDKIGDVDTACVIFLSETDNIDYFLISSKKSLRMKQTFIDWVNMCHNIKIKPKLIVSTYHNS